MTGEWEISRLGDCVTHQKGFAFKSADYRPSGHPIVRVSNFTDRSIDMAECIYLDSDAVQQYEVYKLRTRDAVIATVGSWPTNPASVVGKTICVPEKAEAALLNQNAVRFRTTDDLDQRFLFYLLKQPDFQTYIVGTAQGSASQASITLNDIFGFEFQRPPLTEQKAIAHILGTLDDKIELNRKMNETLEVMAQALFKSWFVDFDPVRAKLEGRKPAGLDAATAALFPSAFQDSELGPIPSGWKVKPLSELTLLITKGTTPTQEDIASALSSNDQVNYVRVNSIDEDGSVLSGKLTMIPESVHSGVLKRSILKSNDVLYTIAGTIGRIAVAEDWILPANTNQAVAIIRPVPTISSGFLILTMRQAAFREELHNNIVHAVQANLSLGMLSKARVIIPPEPTLKRIFKPIDDILLKISANRVQSRALATLRDTLLPKLLSGELRIQEAEKMVEDVA